MGGTEIVVRGTFIGANRTASVSSQHPTENQCIIGDACTVRPRSAPRHYVVHPIIKLPGGNSHNGFIHTVIVRGRIVVVVRIEQPSQGNLIGVVQSVSYDARRVTEILPELESSLQAELEFTLQRELEFKL